MTEQAIDRLLEKQRAYFQSGATLKVEFRIEKLKALYKAIENHRAEISKALTEDLGKSEYEGFMCEIGLVLGEISYMIRHTKRFAAKK